MRAYVTGGSGFVGGWLSAHLEEAGDEVILTDSEVDVTDGEALAAAVVPVAPDVIYHLAALAHVGQSWADPARTFEVNALGTLQVLEAAARCPVAPVVIVVSSAEVYGQAVGDGPLTEKAELRPVTPYAVSKVAAEYLGLQAWLGRGVRAVRVRPFNHLGPGQSPEFVVSALAERIARAEGEGGGEVRVGNLVAARDFTDVRDVVRAYRLLAERALVDAELAGDVFNVATGSAITIAEVARQLCALATAPIEIVQDPALFRPVDVPVFVGDAARLRSITGWTPQVPFEETLADMFDHWRTQLARQR
ncbi:MAG: GDP-mannose 4,6-dehydratase [Acidimicrobiales bacterium]